MTRITTSTLMALAAAATISCHSWVEQLRNIDDQGNYVGQYGYPRGMISRTDPGFNGNAMNWLLPTADSKGSPFITNNDFLCHPKQRQQAQSLEKYPRLKSTPGSFIAMRYEENGHTTFPQAPILGKPEKSGTIFIYMTNQPKVDEKLVDVLRWTKDGQGGDKRGVLMGTNNFDDGRCYLLNDSPISKARQKAVPNYPAGQVTNGTATSQLFCETNVQMPKTVQAGSTQTLYWVWQWNTAAGIDPGLPTGKDEYYSTCIDVDVASDVNVLAVKATEQFAVGQQDAMSIAVADFKQRTAIITDALKGEIGPIFTGKASGTPAAIGAAPPATPIPGVINAPPAIRPTGTPTGAQPPTGEPSLAAFFIYPEAPKPTTLNTRPRPHPSSDTLSAQGGISIVTGTVFITVIAPFVEAAAATGTPASMQYTQGAKFRRAFS